MKLKVLDLFCGAGGLSLGFKMSGFSIVGGIDFNRDALNTHELNFPNTVNLCEDITRITNAEIKTLFPDGVDVIIGGPPCQGFSAANMWQTDEEKIEKNRLFFEYIRFIEQTRPKSFVIENVRQIFTKDEGYAKREIESICRGLGYKVNSSVLDASKFGVPQKRVRAFFVGIREDISDDFNFSDLKTSDDIVTVKDAISDFYDLENSFLVDIFKSKPLSKYQSVMRKNSNNVIYNHEIKYPNERVQERMKYVEQGGNWRQVPIELWDNQRHNRHSSAYRRLEENAVSITIDTGHMNYFHPLYNRVPTVRESARLQSFPDDFVFTGTIGAQFSQVGNAVPPLLAKVIGDRLFYILRKGESIDV